MPRYYRRRRYYSRYSKARRARQLLKKEPVYQNPTGEFRHLYYETVKYNSPGVMGTRDQPKLMQYLRANAIYDIDPGNQPYLVPIGYADANSKYDHYCVTASKITMQHSYWSYSNSTWNMTATQGSQIPIWTGICLQDEYTQYPGVWQQLTRDHTTSWDEMMPGSNMHHSRPFQTQAFTQTLWFSANKYFSTPDPRDVDTLCSIFAGTPTDTAWFVLYMVPITPRPDAATDYGVWMTRIHVDYYVKLFEPKTQGVPL